MSDDVTDVFVLPGFRVVASEVLDGEWHLLVETRGSRRAVRRAERSRG